VLCRSSRSVALLNKSPRSRAASGSSLQRAPRPAPCGVGLKKGDKTRPGESKGPENAEGGWSLRGAESLKPDMRRY
jgi:hypothetical protein